MRILLAMLAGKNKIRDWYRGIEAYYLLCFKPALQYTVYEQTKQAVLAGRKKKALSAFEAFFLGMVARTVATVFVFPFLRAKVLMQSTANAEEEEGGGGASNNSSSESSMAAVLRQQYERGGVAGLYQGIGPELTRGVLSSALMLMIKERIAVTVRQLFLVEPRRPKQHGMQPGSSSSI